jgi:hypothetical protein
MKIEYSLWQGSRLLSVGNVATNINDIDTLVANLNKSKQAEKVKFSANVMKIEVQ